MLRPARVVHASPVPRRTAFCWAGGLVLGAIGIYVHQLWLMWLGSGVIGGIGLGLGYISPVSTLVKWFPDRRGMATGMAIMGFGGGAMIGSPLATMLMNHYATPTPPTSAPEIVRFLSAQAFVRSHMPTASVSSFMLLPSLKEHPAC